MIRLCEAGKLFAVDAWIRAGRSLAGPAEVRRTPLGVALSTRFNSFVELLLRHEERQEAKDEALRYALLWNRPAFIELAITYGADVSAIPFVDALMTGGRGVVTLFLERGADPITGDPFAHAFHELRAKTTLGSYLDCRRSRRELAEALQRQADIALRQFCSDGNLKWVSLMMWVGAGPRSRGPMLEHVDDPEAHTTAMREACASGNVEIVKRLRPGPMDDLTGMLERAALVAHHEVLAYYSTWGPIPTTVPTGARVRTLRVPCCHGFDGDAFAEPAAFRRGARCCRRASGTRSGPRSRG